MSTKRLPIHPATIHFPIVLWFWGALSDTCFGVTADLFWYRSGTLAITAGVLFGGGAMVSGLLDFAGNVREGPAMRQAYLHMGIMGSVWTAFLMLLIWRPKSGVGGTGQNLMAGAEALLVLGCFLGAHIGGRMAYRFGVGVDKTALTLDNKAEGESPIDVR